VRSGCVCELVSQLCLLATEPPPADHDPSLDPPSAREFSCHTLDTLALCLPSKHVLPVVSDFLARALAVPEATARAGALAVLAATVEGTADRLRRHGARGYVIARDAALTGLTDQDADVRHSAAVALVQISMHLQPEVSEDHATMLPPLLATIQPGLSPSEAPRTIEAAVRAVDGVLACFPEGSLDVGYLGQLMPALITLLDKSSVTMHDTLLACATSAAAVATVTSFEPYAAKLLPHLQRYATATEKSFRGARAAATDCVGHVAAVLRPEVARELLPGFLNAALEGFRLGDPLLKDYGYGLLAKGCEVLEQEFVQWLERAVQLAFESLDAVCPLKFLVGWSRT
jgi:importin-4